jgi:hypothetical protein
MSSTAVTQKRREAWEMPSFDIAREIGWSHSAPEEIDRFFQIASDKGPGEVNQAPDRSLQRFAIIGIHDDRYNRPVESRKAMAVRLVCFTRNL